MKAKTLLLALSTLLLISCSQGSKTSEVTSSSSSLTSNSTTSETSNPSSSSNVESSSKIESSSSEESSSSSSSSSETFNRLFGDYKELKETSGWVEEENSITSSSDKTVHTFFKTMNVNKSLFKVNAKYLNHSEGLKNGFGIAFTDQDSNFLNLHVSFNQTNLAVSLSSTSSYLSDMTYFTDMPNTFLKDETFKFEIIQLDTNFALFFNNQQVDTPTLDQFLDKEIAYCLYTINTSVKFTDYTLVSDEAIIQERYDNFYNLGTAKTIDADLSDWTNEDKLNSVKLFGEKTSNVDYSKQGFEAYAKYVKGDGLYIGGYAKHYFNITSKGAWFENTNFEFFINGTSQYYLTSNEINENLNEGSFITILNEEESMYVSTFEAYISETALPYGLINDSYLRMGMAFKNVGEFIRLPSRDNGALTEYWWEDKHYPNLFVEQYYVKEDGIFRTLDK